MPRRIPRVAWARVTTYLRFSLIGLGSIVLLTGCPGENVLQSAGLEVAKTARVEVDQGTSKVMGTLRVPAGILDPQAPEPDRWVFVPGAEVSLVDAAMTPIAGIGSVTTDAQGGFTLERVPRGVPARVRAVFTVGGETYRMQKLIRPSEPLTCSHVDLATTAIADKLDSAQPLVSDDPALSGVDLFRLFISSALEQAESALRKQFLAEAPALAELRTGLSQLGIGATVDAASLRDPSVGAAYHAAFERLDGDLLVRIVAAANNSVGKAPAIPPVFGVLTLQVKGAPASTERVEYWLLGNDLREKIAESTDPDAYKAAFDSWKLADGAYTLAPVLVSRDGSRHVLNHYRLEIDNSVQRQCPLPS